MALIKLRDSDLPRDATASALLAIAETGQAAS